MTLKIPLVEVFGFPVVNFSERAERYRRERLCPFNNKVPHCTKDRVEDPLGVCAIQDKAGHLAITCPTRFHQDWLITSHAAEFFFPEGTMWTSLLEVPLKDGRGRAAGNIDLVLVSYDERGRLLDFGAVEVQAVYISGNVRRAFLWYLENPKERSRQVWPGSWPRADYLSSSRKRLVSQLLYKGKIR